MTAMRQNMNKMILVHYFFLSSLLSLYQFCSSLNYIFSYNSLSLYMKPKYLYISHLNHHLQDLLPAALSGCLATSKKHSNLETSQFLRSECLFLIVLVIYPIKSLKQGFIQDYIFLEFSSSFLYFFTR